jgi:hypothetical protein
MREAVEKFISSGEVAERVRTERKSTSNEGSQFVSWLNEFLEKGGKADNDYYRKHVVGAVKLHDGYWLIKKPSIKNRFCFHDEGPNYEFYKHLMEDREKRLAEYFRTENLAEFDNKIERITKGDEYNHDKRVWWNPCYSDGRIELCFYCSWGTPDGDYRECTDEDKQLILKGLRYGRSLFEKRLDAYLKRYGTSKLHTWTYWADA